MITLSTANDLDSDWIKHANLESARAEVEFHTAYAKALPVQTSLDRIHRIANPKISNSAGKPCGHSFISADKTCWGDKSDPAEIELKARRSVQKADELDWLNKNH